MVNKNINDERKWTTFVEKLIARTQDESIEWKDCRRTTRRERSKGPIFVSEIVADKFVAVYRYTYDYYTDVDEYDEREDIAIELVDGDGEKLWRLPDVPPRYRLIDLLEFKDADAEGTLNAFLGDDA